MHRRGSFVAAVVLSLCLWACASAPKAVPTLRGPDAGHVLTSLEQRNKELESFRGLGKLTITGKGDARSTRLVWIGSRRENLRVETLGTWGEPTLTLLLNGSTFYLHTWRDNRYFKGRATPRNLSRFVPIPIGAEVLFSLLSGQPPLLPFHHAKIHASRGEGQQLLCLYKKWGSLIEKMWLADDGTTVRRVEVLDGWSSPKYTVSFNRFEVVEGLRIPHNITVSHAQGVVLSLKVERFWTKVPIPDGAFTMDLSDAEVLDLDS